MDSGDSKRVEDIIKPVLEQMTTSIVKKKPENIVKCFIYNNIGFVYD